MSAYAKNLQNLPVLLLLSVTIGPHPVVYLISSRAKVLVNATSERGTISRLKSGPSSFIPLLTFLIITLSCNSLERGRSSMDDP